MVGYENAAFEFTVAAYGSLSNWTVSKGLGCSSTIWGPDDAPIYGESRLGIPDHHARTGVLIPNLTSRRAWMEQRLIVSDLPGHSARYLCDSATSYGPDFVGNDTMFCDMGTKSLLPLCSPDDVLDCFELDRVAQVVVIKRAFGRQMTKTFKAYDVVSLWST
ncbi:hypothetical protein D6C99_03336 [Aureobasidium pullulans]|nr:hypothetical protein D6C99_03336 [Aureobasidium pullulans]